MFISDEMKRLLLNYTDAQQSKRRIESKSRIGSLVLNTLLLLLLSKVQEVTTLARERDIDNNGSRIFLSLCSTFNQNFRSKQEEEEHNFFQKLSILGKCKCSSRVLRQMCTKVIIIFCQSSAFTIGVCDVNPIMKTWRQKCPIYRGSCGSKGKENNIKYPLQHQIAPNVKKER